MQKREYLLKLLEEQKRKENEIYEEVLDFFVNTYANYVIAELEYNISNCLVSETTIYIEETTPTDFIRKMDDFFSQKEDGRNFSLYEISTKWFQEPMQEMYFKKVIRLLRSKGYGAYATKGIYSIDGMEVRLNPSKWDKIKKLHQKIMWKV